MRKASGKAGVVAAGLECVDGLPGDLELVGQGALAPAVALSQRLEFVVHRLGVAPSSQAPADRSHEPPAPQVELT